MRNLQEINEWRMSQGLRPLEGDSRKRERAIARERNQRERAAANRELKSKRNKGK